MNRLTSGTLEELINEYGEIKDFKIKKGIRIECNGETFRAKELALRELEQGDMRKIERDHRYDPNKPITVSSIVATQSLYVKEKDSDIYRIVTVDECDTMKESDMNILAKAKASFEEEDENFTE